MKTEIEINMTPDELAEMFVGWGSMEQGQFFNLIGKHFKSAKWYAEGQCCAASEVINKDGKDFLFTLSNFVKCQKIKPGSPHEAVLINAYDPCSLREDTNAKT